jgi:hypothetical protein
MRFRNFVALIGIFSLLITGCARPAPLPTYTFQDIPIEAKVNEQFIILVEIDVRDFQYFWEQDFDSSKLQLIQSTCVLCSPDTITYGQIQGPYNSFHYRALEQGSTTITMTHRRPQESREPAETRVFEVNIR